MKLYLKWDHYTNPYIGHVFESEEKALRGDVLHSVMTVWSSVEGNPEASEKRKQAITNYFNAANLMIDHTTGLVD